MEGSEEVQLIDSLNDRAFAIVEDGIYFIPGRRGLPFTPSVRTSIQFYSFADGSVQRLVEIAEPWIPILCVSPDGQWFLYDGRTISCWWKTSAEAIAASSTPLRLPIRYLPFVP